MPAESTSGSLRRSVRVTLAEDVPQLRNPRQAIEQVEPTAERVTLSLGCGCSNGASEVTKRAIERVIIDGVEEISTVTFDDGCGCGGQQRTDSTPTDEPEAPF